jgi:hypothetical protein
MKPLLLLAVAQAHWTPIYEGRTEPAAEFTYILDATTGPADRVVFVLDPRLGAVRGFDRVGRQTVAFGRHGEGPGELARAVRLGWVFDTIWVLDAPSRMHYFRPDGRLLRTFAAPRGTWGASAVGGFIAQQLTGTVPGPGPRGAVAISHLTGSNERRIAGVTEFVGVVQVKMRVNGQSGTIFQRQPFGDDPLFLPDRDGRYLFIVLRQTSPAPPNVFRVIKLSLYGDTVFTKSFPYRPRALDHALIVEKVEQMMGVGSENGRKVTIEPADLENAMYRPHHLPAVSRAVIGRDGSIWLQREDSPGALESTWQVLSPSGESLATLRLPRAERLLEVSADRLWTAALDENDVPFVKWYRIDRRL